MNLLLACTLALCIYSVVGEYEAFKDGYFHGRSADVVIDTPVPVEIQLDWQLTRKLENGEQEKLTSVRDFHVHNLMARALGLPQVRLPAHLSLETEMEDTVPFDFFSQLHGNMLFSVEGFSSDLFPETSKVFGKTPTYSLSQTSRPYHPHSTLATVVSGVLPRRHGVINERSGHSVASNIFDSSKMLYSEEGQSVVISGALSKSRASVTASREDSLCFYWDSETEAFVSVEPSATSIMVNKRTIPSFLASLEYSLPLKFDETEAKIGEVSFDSSEIDRSLFLEVAFVAAWTNQFGSDGTTQRFFSFHFTSLSALATKYGTDSAQWLAAVELIDHLLSRALAHNCAFEIIYLPARQASLLAAVTPVVSKYTPAGEEASTQIYLSSEEAAEICSSIKEELADLVAFEATVFCPHEHELEKRGLGDDNIIALTPLVSTPAQILAFHYVFWTMLVLLVVLIWAMCAMAAMPPDESIETAMNFKKGRI